uniref:Heterogeneous nuclear ribonucleoprotein K n=1 Tax=Parastrongyloides trichosuri TaxID=131310 RepID=A0A0N4Z9R9_PARTI
MYQEPIPKVETLKYSPEMKRRSPTNDILNNQLIDVNNAESEVAVIHQKRTKQDENNDNETTNIINNTIENTSTTIDNNTEENKKDNNEISSPTTATITSTADIVIESKVQEESEDNTTITIVEGNSIDTEPLKDNITKEEEEGDNTKKEEVKEGVENNSEMCETVNNSGSDNPTNSSNVPSTGRQHNNSNKDSKYEIRLLLATRMAGAVIGRAGSVIKKLRSEYNANISIPDKKMPERVLTISASYDNIMNIFDVVLPRILEEQRNSTDDNEIRMIVHQSQAGAIIGRAGSKVKELREKSHAFLKVYTDFCPRSTDRVIQITGNQEKIRSAVSLIIEYLKGIPIKGNIQNYDASNYNPSQINNYGGYPGPVMIRDMRSYPIQGCPPTRGGAPPQPIHNRGIGGSDRGGYYEAPYQQYNGPPMYNSNKRAGGGNGGGYQSGNQQQQYNRPPMEYINLNRGGGGIPPAGQDFTIQTNQVSIPNNYCGLVIGREGSKIKQIRQKSGAKIEVEPSHGTMDRIITIQGTYSQIQMAQYLLQSCIKNQESTGAKRNYGGQRYQ